MPPTISVSSLQNLSLRCISKVIRMFCEDKNLSVYDIIPSIQYFQILPKSLQIHICSVIMQNYKKEHVYLKLNEKHHFTFIYLNSEELHINEFNNSLLFLNDLKGNDLKTLSLLGTSLTLSTNKTIGEEDDRLRLYRPLHNFILSLSNLTSFKAVRMCDDLIFDLFSKHCPALEEIDVELSFELTDEGVCYLCGFDSSSEVSDMLMSPYDNPPASGCKNLKRITLDFTTVSNLSAAALLKWCKKIEILNINPDLNIVEVFSLIHGTDIAYEIENSPCRYSLTSLRSILEIEEDTLALIARTCPNIEDIAFRCYGVERKDKNLLDHLLRLPIRSLNLSNCNTKPLLWYLKQKGNQIEKLVIEHLLTAPSSAYLDRSHLQVIISVCPNITHFSLKMCANVTIAPNVPYSSFGDNVQYFTTLKELSIVGVCLQPDDVKILISRSKGIEEITIMCQTLDILEDKLLYELLAEGALRNIRSLYAYKPLLTMVGLNRLLMECPSLRKVGPLSSWGIPKAEMDLLMSEIKRNNWDLNIESAETLHASTFYY